MTTLAEILWNLLNIAKWILIIHIVMGWLITFQVLNIRQPVVAQIFFGLNNLLEPIYRPIRRYLPQTGGLDFSPIVVFIAIMILQTILASNFYF